MNKIGVILSGCGVLDGSEIHESVLTLLAVEKEGMSYQCYAPNIPMPKVVNHYSNKLENEKRNVLVESARIARGNIIDLKELNLDDIDGLILPGGFGAACNLSSFAQDGSNAIILSDLIEILKKAHAQKKPIGAICIAPNIIAKVFGHLNVQVTIGNDTATVRKLEDMGAKHINKNVDEIVIDKENLIVSTPAYMLGKNLVQIEAGISRLVSALAGLIREKSLTFR